MATPNMTLIAASLERSLQNFSLNHQQSSSSSSSSSSSGGAAVDSAPDVAAAKVELNSETALPYHWEQCLDLKTGEIYYINWRTGMKMKEDPRAAGGGWSSEDSTSYDSEESSSESSPSSSREQWSGNNNSNHSGIGPKDESQNLSVLVVAGCKSCLMYYMVPKQLGICPKCCGDLLHFDSGSSSSSSSS